MIFSSLTFLFFFLPIFLIVYFLTSKAMRNVVLMLFSLFFYAWGEPIYIGIMLFSIVFDYTLGIIMNKYRENKVIPKATLIVSIIGNLSLLGFFKYQNFFINSLNNIFDLDIRTLSIALPVGISFYTFQTMSYSIDLYRGRIDVQRNFISFGAYVSMFPQLIAGPIVKYSDIENELDNRQENVDDFAYGVQRFIEGLFKKVFLANNIGLIWDTISGVSISDTSVIMLWLGVIAFGLQLYFDFSGYSDMAIGLGRMLGFIFPENFNFPYIARSATDFWRRWHITLGSWFREYVYIPLGGNRVDKFRLLINIFVVWFLTGFWHGAGWNFIVWGLIFAIALTIEKLFIGKYLSRMPYIVSWLYTMIVVCISWVFFANDDILVACRYVKNMFGFGNISLVNMKTMYIISNYWVYIIMGILFATPIVKKIKQKINPVLLCLINMFLLFLCTAYLVDSTFNPFLYFRF